MAESKIQKVITNVRKITTGQLFTIGGNASTQVDIDISSNLNSLGGYPKFWAVEFVNCQSTWVLVTNYWTSGNVLSIIYRNFGQSETTTNAQVKILVFY